MLVASVASREVFWHLGVALKVLWYALAVASVGVFAYGVARSVAKYRRGRPGTSTSAVEVRRRARAGLREVVSQARIARRDRVAGWAHGALFYGFLVLFAGTVILGFDTDFTDPVFGWNYFHGDFYLAYKEILNLFGTALVVGVLVMMGRRGLVRPAKLDYARPDRVPGEEQFNRRRYRVGDWVFVSTLLVIALTGFLLEGVRIAMSNPGYGGTQFVGWLFARPLLGAGIQTLGDLRHALWWFHGLLAITFVASIPHTKAAHMLTSLASTLMRDPRAGARLEPIPSERASEAAGYGALADFSRLHLLQLDACTKCGRCHEACPAHESGRPLSPRDLILELREQANGAQPIGGLIGRLLAGGSDGTSFTDTVIGRDGVRSETVWSCMQCNACVEICPVGIEQAPIINQLRRRLVDDGDLDPSLQSTLEVIHKSGNSFGAARRTRGSWTQELDFAVKDARAEPVDVLWFVGDYASFDPRSQQVTRALARLLHDAGVDFGILYDGELNSGNDVRRVGEEGLFESLAERNIATMSGCDFRRIMTTDPHSLNTLRNEYAELGGSWSVVHHTGLLLDLLDDGLADACGRLAYRVTYHDPCHLGRMNGEYKAPREILTRLGCTLVEMPRNRDNSFCCGAGGGRIWMADPPGSVRPSESRISEAVGLEEVALFVVSCPKDVTMYEDAIKTSGNSACLELREITELIGEALTSGRALG